MFALLMEPYATTQVSILRSVINQAGRNVASTFYICFGGTLGNRSRHIRAPRNRGWKTLVYRMLTNQYHNAQNQVYAILILTVDFGRIYGFDWLIRFD